MNLGIKKRFTSKIEIQMTIQNKDPIEGFHFIAYDEATEELTIEIDPAIIKNPSQEDPLVKKAIEMMTHGKGVSRVVFIPR